MLSNALSGNRGAGLFAVVQDSSHGTHSGRQAHFPGSAGGAGGGSNVGSGMMGNDGFAIPSAISVPSTASTTAGDVMAEAQRRAMATVGTIGAGGGGVGGGGSKNATRRPTVVTAGAE